MRAAHAAIADENIADAARNFAADADTAVTVLHCAIGNDEVFARNCQPTAVAITTRFYGDTIVAGVKGAILNQYSIARFGIAAVIVRTVAVDADVPHRDVGAKHRMNLPHRRIAYGYSIDQDILALVGLDELRS